MPKQTDASLAGILILAKNEAGYIVFCLSAGNLSDTASKFAIGCVLIDTTTGKQYYNAGTVAVPSWNSVSEVATAEIADAGVTPAKTNIVEARTATTDGTGTGTISDTSTHVTVTSDNADKIIVLPTPTPGRMLVINNGATGYELRSSAPATIAINGGSGSGAESAIAANSTVIAICITATAWKAIFLDADSDVAKVEAAA